MAGKPKELSPDRLAYTIPETSRILGISVGSGWRRAADGTLPVVRIGGCVRVPREALNDLLSGKGRS